MYFCFSGRKGYLEGHTYVFVSHDRGVVLIEFAGLPESEYGWAGMESTLKAVVESLRRRARIVCWVGFLALHPSSCDSGGNCAQLNEGRKNERRGSDFFIKMGLVAQALRLCLHWAML